MTGNKYHFNIALKTEKHNAGSKAVEDCKVILTERGYQNIDFRFDKKNYLIIYNLIKLVCGLLRRSLWIKNNSIVIIQYPLLGINNRVSPIIKILKKRDCFVACIIHDLESLRFQKNAQEVKKEILNLESYDVVISHNRKMTAWLRTNGLKNEIIDLEIFDYLSTTSKHHPNDYYQNRKKEIIFAGSLQRGSFIYKLRNVKGDLLFKLFGDVKDQTLAKGANVTLCGSVSPNKILNELSGDFGLIWDGEAIDQCKGIFGDYLRFNNPHKLSLYLAAEIPIIIPEDAALADFVVANNLGFAIKNLSEIDEKVKNLTREQYQEMVANVLEYSQKVRGGYFFKTALDKIEQIWKSTDKERQ